MTDVLHPDHLKPGDTVGPWRIVATLGVGGSARVFEVDGVWDKLPGSKPGAVRLMRHGPVAAVRRWP